MRRFLLLLAVLALGAMIALLVTRSRAALPTPTDAPLVRAAGRNALESTDSGAPTREAQATLPADSSAPERSVRIHGRVFFEGTRDPVAGAPIQINYREPAPPESQQKLSSARTAADGSYSAFVPDGALLCDASVLAREREPGTSSLYELTLDAYLPSTRNLDLRAAHSDIELDLVVGLGLSLHGTVVERGSERPISGAEVVFQNGIDSAFGTTSAADGSFTVRGFTLTDRARLGSFMRTVSATHADYARGERALGPPDEQDRWPEIVLELDAGVSVEGIVSNVKGEPVESLELRLRPLHGTAQPGVCEYEGEWKATSDRSGIFKFPRVPAFDRAWLVTNRKRIPSVVPDVESWRWHGASRTLLHGKDPNLRSVDLHLPLEVAVEIDVRFPDGAPATQEERLLLREDEDGNLRAARGESHFVCVAGRATRIVAWGKAREKDEDDVIYRGETVVTVGANGADPQAEIRLAPQSIPRREPLPGERSMGFGAGMWTNSAITLHFIDRASGLPLGGNTLLGIERDWERSISLFGGAEAVLRLYFEPGWESMKLTIGGYQAYTIELEVKDNEPQELTLPLERLR